MSFSNETLSFTKIKGFQTQLKSTNGNCLKTPGCHVRKEEMIKPETAEQNGAAKVKVENGSDWQVARWRRVNVEAKLSLSSVNQMPKKEVLPMNCGEGLI
jgi:hypothetical protein